MTSIYCEDLDGECFTFDKCEFCDYHKSGKHKPLQSRKEKKTMDNFFMFNNRIFNKNYVTCAYVQYSAFTEVFTPVCEISGSKSPVQLDTPTEDSSECVKVLQDFYAALEGR